MVIVRLTDGVEHGDLLILGLAREDREHLQKGLPICLDQQDGAVIPEGLQLVIFWGETEASIRQELEAHGIIDPATIELRVMHSGKKAS